MIEVIKNYEPQPTGRKPTYDWDGWFRRAKKLPKDAVVHLVRGRDFDCEVDTMRAQIYSEAKKRQLTVTVHVKTIGDDKRTARETVAFKIKKD